MKLIYCPACRDMRKIQHARTECSCGASWGTYKMDGLHAIIGGRAVPIAIANPDIEEALEREDHNALRCWVMRNAPHIEREETE